MRLSFPPLRTVEASRPTSAGLSASVAWRSFLDKDEGDLDAADLEVGDRIEANAVRGAPCFSDCSFPSSILLANRREGNWKFQRLHCRSCGVTWRRIWVG